MKQLFNKYLLGSLFLLGVLLVPAYKSEAVGGVNVYGGPFEFSSQIVKTTISGNSLLYEGLASIRMIITVEGPRCHYGNGTTGCFYDNTNSIPPDTDYLKYFITNFSVDRQGALFASKYYYTNGVMYYPLQNPGIHREEMRADSTNQGYLSKVNISIYRQRPYNNLGDELISSKDIYPKDASNPDSDYIIPHGSNGTNRETWTTGLPWDYDSDLEGVSKLPAGKYRVVVNTYPYVKIFRERCMDTWYRQGCGLLGIGDVQSYVYNRIWNLNSSYDFTISPGKTPPSGDLTIAGCKIPVDGNTCIATLNWTTKNLTTTGDETYPATGNVIKVYQLSDVKDDSGAPIATEIGSGQNGSATVTLRYGPNPKNSFKLTNDTYISTNKQINYDNVSYNATCANNLKWNGTKCVTSDVIVHVTVDPYTDITQKSVTIPKGKQVRLKWTTEHAPGSSNSDATINCSCYDSDNKDCFAKGSYPNYAGYSGSTASGQTDPITVDESTRFNVTCK